MKQMFEQENKEIEINLRELYIAFKKNLIKIILVTALFAGIVGGYTNFFVEPIYSSTAELYILASESGQQIYNLSVSDQLAQDYIRLVTTKTVLQTAIDDLNLDMDYRELQGNVTVENPTDTRFMTITVRDHDAARASKLANRIATVTSRMVSRTMDVPEPTIVESAEEAEYPDGPNLRMNTILGGFIGFALSAFVVLVKGILNDTIKNEDDIERYLGTNMLAQLPSEQKHRRKNKKKKKNEFKNL